ncbi:hypothetical protein IC582_007876 [Cucumis melo]
MGCFSMFPFSLNNFPFLRMKNPRNVGCFSMFPVSLNNFPFLRMKKGEVENAIEWE